MTTLATTKLDLGIIPFGSEDSAVLFQCSMDSEASVTGALNVTGTLIGTGHTFTEGLGVIQPVGAGLKFAEPIGYSSLEKVSQISFEIESEFMAEFEATPIISGTDGHDNLFNDYIITWASAKSAAPYGRLYCTASGDTPFFNLNSTDAQFSNLQVTNLGKDRFMRITLSSLGGITKVFYDGAHVANVPSTTAVDLFKNFYTGSFRGIVTDVAGGQVLFYMRNLIVSNRAVMTGTHPMLSRVKFGGDSFASQAFTVFPHNSGGGYDHAASLVIDGYLRSRGIGINLHNSGVSGTVVDPTNGTDWAAQADGGVDFMATNDTIGVLQIGTNDCNSLSTFTKLAFKISLNVLISNVMATKEYLILGNVPTVKTANYFSGDSRDTQQFRDQVREANEAIVEVVDEWHAANPSRGDAIRTYDLFTVTGGESPDADMFNGSWANANDLHLSSRGRKVVGEIIAAELYKLLFA